MFILEIYDEHTPWGWEDIGEFRSLEDVANHIIDVEDTSSFLNIINDEEDLVYKVVFTTDLPYINNWLWCTQSRAVLNLDINKLEVELLLLINVNKCRKTSDLFEFDWKKEGF